MRAYVKSSMLVAAIAAVVSLALARPCAADVTPRSLTLPGGSSAGVAVAVNASGQAAGSVNLAGDNGIAACMWKADGTPIKLPELDLCDGTFHWAQAKAINESGVVVGFCHYADGWHTHCRATRWVPQADGTYAAEDLGVIDGQSESDAIAINAEGQILCNSGFSSEQSGDPPYFLWEAGVRTEVRTADGTAIDALGGMVYVSVFGMLGPSGRVAGNVNGQAVLWQKTSSGPAVTTLTSGPGDVEAISPNGVVAGRSGVSGQFFVYDSKSETFAYVDTVPPAGLGLSYVPRRIVGVNDDGHALFECSVYDNGWPTLDVDCWVWEAGTWTEVPVDGLAIPANAGAHVLASINNSGQVAGYAVYYIGEDDVKIGFCWSAGTGTKRLVAGSAEGRAVPTALNDSGVVAGGADFPNSITYLPAVWSPWETDTAPPVITVPADTSATAASTAGAAVTFAASATDDVNGSVPVTCDPASGSTFPLGTTTVNCTAHDTAGNQAAKSFKVTVTYSWSGFLQPIDPPNDRGISASVFKAGSVVPVRFALTGASAGITNAVATLSYVKVGNGLAGSDVEAISNAQATTGNQFRYDPTSKQYAFNWSTKGLSSGSYQLTISLGDGVSRTVIISLR